MSTTMGVINTLLSNNVITAQLTPELKFKASYRYDNFDNGTPEIRFADWVLTDAASAKANANSYAPVQTLSISYMRQNAGMEPGRGLQMGALRLGTCRRLRHQPSGTLLCLRLLPAQALSGMVVGLAAAVVVVNAKKL
jgi:hypothetical protein